MKLFFVKVLNQRGEIDIGHRWCFSPSKRADGISATANVDGFTVLSAIGSHFGWKTEDLGWFVKECNVSDKVIMVPTLPRLVLVPRTRSDDKRRARIYIEQLFEVVHSFGVRELSRWRCKGLVWVGAKDFEPAGSDPTFHVS